LPYIAHATSSVANPITVKEFFEFVCHFYKERPLRDAKLTPEVTFVDGEKRFQINHFLKFALPEKISSSHTYKKIKSIGFRNASFIWIFYNH